ncbi:cation-translocating P-type ATPase [Rubripirellula amarantea]|uniref:cation-translocating P-type ATPase n=1 Tax=Rubripirellula amarantea TaxID=2527999 RepID=UPI001F5E3B0E|nr:HAD-IC family P-type ATPase [Rubripirellula amarantea]
MKRIPDPVSCTADFHQSDSLAMNNETAPSKAVYASTSETVLDSLGTNVSLGLTSDEAKARLQQFGPNALQSAAVVRWYHVLGRQFTDVLIVILAIAAVVSFAVGEVADALTIVAIVLLNGVLGFVQEWKAERAIEALQKMLSPQCTVVRDGDEKKIDAVELVPGDIVQLETGDSVPADLRFIQARNVRVDESALTGESDSIPKQTQAVDAGAPLAERACMAWMGTAVTAGRAACVVTATGPQTQFGQIAKMTESLGHETTPLQIQLSRLGKQLGAFAVFVSIAVAVAGWWMGQPVFDMFLTGISLAVAVVPEGLPAVVTLTLALGVREMVRRKALLRRLRAAETLGAATIVCTDKTGTLTQNQMTVRKIWLAAGEVDVTGIGYDPAGHFVSQGEKLDYRSRSDLIAMLESGLRCNHAKLRHDSDGWHESGEPTEAAIVVAAHKAWLDPVNEHETIEEFSFTSSRKRMTIVQCETQNATAHSKGAPEVLLPLCSRIRDGDQVRDFNQTDRDAVETAITTMAELGLRTLAIARREFSREHVNVCDENEIEQDFTLLGIVGMLDPPRSEVSEAISLAVSAGIRVLMITGDSPQTATAIAQKIGLPVERSVTGGEIDQFDSDQLSRLLEKDVVFARTTPEHKLRIVESLQAAGHVVGMTGDGVNDAPALKRADIGIAMGRRGTDVAKGASDMILTDDNFSSIISAIEEGRRQYANIQKFVRYLLSSNTGEVVLIFVNILIGGPLVLLPVQILWMNLVTDGLSAVALGLEPADKSMMQRPPRRPDSPVIDGYGFALIAALGTYIGLATLWLFHNYLISDDARKIAVAQTVAFTCIVMIEKANVFNFRSLTNPLHRLGLLTNPWVLIAVAFTIALQVAAVYVPFLQDALHTVPLNLGDWARIAALSLPILLVTESVKWWRAT